MDWLIETIRSWPDAFKATVLTVGFALVLTAIFGGKKVGPIEIPAFEGLIRWLAIGTGLAFLVLGSAASLKAPQRADVVVRANERDFFLNEYVLVAENHSDTMSVPNKHIACKPTDGSWTSGAPPVSDEPMAPTFVAMEPFPLKLTSEAQALRFRLDWNFQSDPGRLPLRGRLACVYAYRVTSEEFEAAKFDIVYLETEESSGNYVFFTADRYEKSMTLDDFEALLPMAPQTSP